MFESKFTGKSILKKPMCPFCGMPIERPTELENRRHGEMPVGKCSCGAVYACDESGKNVGQALIEALVFGCNMDWDLAWSLLPEEDYWQEIVDNYDYLNHYIVTGGVFQSRRINGVLYFIRFHEEVEEVTSEAVLRRLERVTKPHHPSGVPPDHSRRKSLSKAEVEQCVTEYRIEPILNAAAHDKKLIRKLQRLLYSGDDLLRKRAADILGKVSALIAEENPRTISKLLQGLFYAITDTAASGWGAFEAIGEIIGHKPELFAGYIPQLYQFLQDKTRRVAALQTIGRIAKARPDLFRNITYHFIALLPDPDPLVRGSAVWLLGNLSAHEARQDLESLQSDPHEITIYEAGDLKRKTVGQLAEEALYKL